MASDAFSWEGKTFEIGRYQDAIKTGYTPEPPPKLNSEEWARLSDKQKNQYTMLDRAYKRYEQDKKRQQQLEKQKASVKSISVFDADKAKVKVVNSEGRELGRHDFKLMRQGLLTVVDEVRLMQERIDKALSQEMDPSKQVEFIKLRKMVEIELNKSSRLVKGTGGYTSDEFTKLIEGFEKIEQVADDLDSYLINSERINAFFLKNRIDAKVDITEKARFAKVLAQLGEKVGVSVKDVGKLAPDKLSTTTGGLATSLLTSVFSSLGPLGEIANMLVLNPEIANQVETFGANDWNKTKSRWRGRKVTGALVGEQAEAVKVPSMDSTVGRQTAEQGEDFIARLQNGEVGKDELEQVLRDVFPDGLTEDKFKELFEQFKQGSTEAIEEMIEKTMLASEGNKEEIAKLITNDLSGKVDALLRENVAGDDAELAGSPMISQIGKVVTEGIEKALKAHAVDLSTKLATAIEVPVDQMPMSAADQRNLDVTNAKEKAAAEENAREKTQKFLESKFDAVIKTLDRIAEGGGGLLNALGVGGAVPGGVAAAAGGFGLKKLWDKFRGKGVATAAGEVAEGAGKSGVLARLAKATKGVPTRYKWLAAMAAGAYAMMPGEENEAFASVIPDATQPSKLTAPDSSLRMLEDNKDGIGFGASLLSGAGKLGGRVFTPVAASVDAYDRYQELKDRTDLSAAQKAGDVTGTAGGAWAGGLAGAALLGGWGSIFGPLGTFAGGVAGGVGGAFLGTKAGQYAGQKAGAGYDATVDSTASLLDWLSGNSAATDLALADTPMAGRARRPGKKSDKGPNGLPRPPMNDFERNAKILQNGDNLLGQMMGNMMGSVAPPPSFASSVVVSPSSLPLHTGATSEGEHVSKAGVTYTPATQAAEKAVDAASGSMGGKRDPGAKPAAGSAITALGYYIQSLGYRVGGHKNFGGVESWRDPANPHSLGEAIDINDGGGGVTAREMASLDRLYAHLKPLHDKGQILLWWRKPQHFDHMHIQIPKGKRGWGDHDPALFSSMSEMGIPVQVPVDAKGGSATATFSPTGGTGAGDTAATAAMSSSPPVAQSRTLPMPSAFPSGLGAMPDTSPTVNVNVAAPEQAQAQVINRQTPNNPGMQDATFSFDDTGLNAAAMGVI